MTRTDAEKAVRERWERLGLDWKAAPIMFGIDVDNMLADKQTLKYKIKRTKRRGEVTFKAEPNEWACDASIDVILKNDSSYSTKETPRIEHIHWSAGARDWTLQDAKTFFTACLEMLDAAENEFTLAAYRKQTGETGRSVPQYSDQAGGE